MLERDDLARWPSVADVANDHGVTFAYVYSPICRLTRPRAGVSSAHAGGVLAPRSQTPELEH
jgi:hypothetical protein